MRRGARDKAGHSLCLGIILVVLSFGGASDTLGAVLSSNLEFNPQLSLTGDCATSEVDPVPDPGCPGENHPPLGSFRAPQSVATDNYGNIYVASYGNGSANGGEGRIDIFNPAGEFITEISDPFGPKNLAVDSKGNLYVFQFRAGLLSRVARYEPSLYEPEAGEIEYAKPPVQIVETNGFVAALAVNRSNDHLYVHKGSEVQEFSSAEDENKPLDTIGSGILFFPQGRGLAVDATHKVIYVSNKRNTPPEDFLIDVFELEPPHALLQRIDGKDTPEGHFVYEPSVAVDEEKGNVLAFPEGKVIYQLTEEGDYVGQIEHGFQYVSTAGIGVDNGALSPHPGYLFVPSHPTGEGHVFAFGPSDACSARVISTFFSNVMEGEAEIRGVIDPCNLETSYVFEYTSQERYNAEKWAEAQLADKGKVPIGAAPVPVSAVLSGLSPGTTYRFRLIAINALGADEAEGELTTYPLAELAHPCPNEAMRTGFSAHLPDCRAYELVTPPATNARAPRGVGLLGIYFPTREASPVGDKVSFITEGGSLPGSEGTGSLGGDPYLSTRGPGGWTTSPAGPSGGESVTLMPGSTSPDQGYSFWSTGGIEGSAVMEGKVTAYIRYPDGHSAPIGRGSLGADPLVRGKLISENGSHVIFMTTNEHTVAVQLEPNAPPDGTQAVYDRTSNEVTHVVSLLPGDKTPAAGQDADYVGASLDGRGVAFEIGSTLYLRYENDETYEIGKDVTFAGVAEGGNRIFYVEGGKLLRFDALTGKVTAFNSSGTAVPVNVSADGSAAYFVSTSVLTTKANPNGAKAEAGRQNLYLSREGAISFVGTVTERDVQGDMSGNEPVEGLGLWSKVVGIGRLGADPSRTTPAGTVLLFESRAKLTHYDSQGVNQVYRYDFIGNELDCLSCNPTGTPPVGAASLQSITQSLGDPEPFSSYAYVANLRSDGRRAFFQSTDPLVPTDTNGLQDIYQWEDQGVGGCTHPGGCIFLISSGQSKRATYLYAVSDSGDDVFFRSSDLLVLADRESTSSIYDARVSGGFAEEPEVTCEGEGCRTALPAPPPMTAPESAVHNADKKGRKNCPKGKRKARRHGKARCIKKRGHRRHHRHKANPKKKGGRK